MHNSNASSAQKPFVSSGIKRPEWVCSNSNQNVIVVRDGSGSMIGEKAKSASKATMEFVEVLAEPVNKDGFNVAIVEFSDSSKRVHDLQKATILNGNVKALKVGFFSGSTNITAGLEEAESILSGANGSGTQGVTFLKPVVLLFSDGCHNTGPDPHNVARRLKASADLVTVAFGADADEAMLQALATTPQHFYRCATGRDLRHFLAAVGATISMSRTSGKNATQLLTSIPRNA